MPSTLKYQHASAEMDRIGAELTRRYRISLTKQGKNASGNLNRSIRHRVIQTDYGVELVHEMAAYADFVNKGVQGAQENKAPKSANAQSDQLGAWGDSPYRFGKSKFPSVPAGKIDAWAVKKNVQGTRDESGRFTPRKGMIRAISRSIYRRGLVPSLFIDRPYNRMKKQNLRNIAQAVAKDALDYVRLIIEG